MAKKQTKDKVEKGSEVKVTKEDIVAWKKMIDTIVKKESGIIYLSDGTCAHGLVRNTNKYELIMQLIVGFNIDPEDLVKVMLMKTLGK